MKAVVYKGPKEVAVEEVPDAKIERPTDVVVKITTTNICIAPSFIVGKIRIYCFFVIIISGVINFV